MNQVIEIAKDMLSILNKALNPETPAIDMTAAMMPAASVSDSSYTSTQRDQDLDSIVADDVLSRHKLVNLNSAESRPDMTAAMMPAASVEDLSYTDEQRNNDLDRMVAESADVKCFEISSSGGVVVSSALDPSTRVPVVIVEDDSDSEDELEDDSSLSLSAVD